MKYIEPKHVLAIINSGDGECYLRMQKARMDRAAAYVLSRNNRPVWVETIRRAQEYLMEETDISFSAECLNIIMSLHPIEMSLINDLTDTDEKEAVLDMVASFYLGSSWPISKDAVKVTEWVNVLKALKSAYEYVTTPVKRDGVKCTADRKDNPDVVNVATALAEIEAELKKDEQDKPEYIRLGIRL